MANDTSTRSVSIPILIAFSILLVIERFFMPVFSYSLITSFVGIIALCLFFYFAEFSFSKVGVTIDKNKKPLLPLLYGIGVPVASILIVLLLEQILWLILGHKSLAFVPEQDLYFQTLTGSSILYTGVPNFLKWAALGVGICLVRALFYELSFRGYFYFDVTEHFSQTGGNRIQAVAYMFMAGLPSIITLVQRYKAVGPEIMSVWMLCVLIGTTLLNLLLMGLRQGTVRENTGSVWMSVTSFLIFDYFNTIYHSSGVFTGPLAPYAVVFRSLAVQIVAALLNIPMTVLYLREIREKMREGQTEEFQVDTDKIIDDILHGREDWF